MTTRTLGLILLVPALLAACKPDEQEKKRTEARTAAARDACVAEELAIRGRANQAALDTVAAGGGLASPVAAAYQFAQVYRAYADAMASAAAYTDSAVSAKTPADSTRYVQKARGFLIGPAEPGTVEANVAVRYAREFQGTRSDPNHYCNQEPLGGGEPAKKE